MNYKTLFYLGIHAAFRGFAHCSTTTSDADYKFAEKKYQELEDGQLFFIAFTQVLHIYNAVFALFMR